MRARLMTMAVDVCAVMDGAFRWLQHASLTPGCNDATIPRTAVWRTVTRGGAFQHSSRSWHLSAAGDNVARLSQHAPDKPSFNNARYCKTAYWPLVVAPRTLVVDDGNVQTTRWWVHLNNRRWFGGRGTDGETNGYSASVVYGPWRRQTAVYSGTRFNVSGHW